MDLSDGATISLPTSTANGVVYGSTVTNAGIMNIAGDSVISSAEFVNTGHNASITIEGGSQIQTNTFTNDEGATVTLTLTTDDEGNVIFPIKAQSDPESGSPDIENYGTIVLDASGLDYSADPIKIPVSVNNVVQITENPSPLVWLEP